MADKAYQPPGHTAVEDEHLSFLVERVLDHNERPFRCKTRQEHLVKWIQYSPKLKIFGLESNLQICSDLVGEYWLCRSKTQAFGASGPQPLESLWI